MLLQDTWARLLKSAGEDPHNASDDVLRKLSARTGLSYKQLRSVRHARNACAHGESSQIDQADLLRQIQTAKLALDRVTRSFDELAGTRRRQLERPLRQIEDLRRERGLPVDGELFAELPAEDAETPPGGNIRRLGA